MADGAPPDEVVLVTDRLLLRPWRVADAALRRELWTERDPRTPPHRRIGPDGRPTLADLEEAVRTEPSPTTTGLLAVVPRDTGEVIGYCGLLASGRGPEGEYEIAYELLRRTWGQGYATEAAAVVVDWARSSGFERLWATVWEWNPASLRVLAKVGFTRTGRREVDPVRGTVLFLTREL